MPDLNKIIEDLSSLTVAEAADLSKQLEEKWGVTPMTAAAPVAAGGAAGGAVGGAAGGGGRRRRSSNSCAGPQTPASCRRDCPF